MGGSSTTIGFHYLLAYLHGLCKGPIDSFYEFRGGKKVAWSGNVTSSTLIPVNSPMLWGGEKDQGGIVGGLRVMFGEAGQMPNAYLVGVFGEQMAAFRGMATVAFEGGRYGAMNPYPQPASYFVSRIVKGWDDDACWYAAKAPVPIGAATVVTTLVNADVALDANTSSPDGTGVGYDFTVPAGSTIVVRLGPSSDAWSYTPSDDYNLSEFPLTWTHRFGLRNINTGEVSLIGWVPGFLTAADARAAHAAEAVTLTVPAGGNFRLFLYDATVDDNRGISSYRIEYTTPVSYHAKNPAHMLVYAHTQQETGRESIATVNSASAESAADWFYAQGFGLGTARRPNAESPGEFTRRIEKVAACSFTRSMSDGLYYIDIANGVYVLDDLPILTDDDVLDFKEIPTVLSDAINSVSVKYFDPWRNESVITPPVRAMGLVAQFGVIHQTYDYPEIPTGPIAVRVAHRELLASTTPTRAFDLATNRTPRSWRKNTYFRAQLAKRGIADMVCMVADLQDGQLKSGGMKLTAVQDIYSLPATVYTEVEHGVDPRPPSTPTAIEDQRAIEAPYINVVPMVTATELAAIPSDAGYVIGMAVDPSQSRDFDMFVAPGGNSYSNVGTGEFSPSVLAGRGVAPGETLAIPYTGASQLAGVQVGDLLLWDDELCRVDAIDPTDTAIGTLDLGRGCGDSVPRLHLTGSRMFFYQQTAAYDRTQYIAGETVNVKLLTNSFSKQLALADATAMPVTFDQRFDRPYPPANLVLNGLPFYGTGSGSGPITPGGGTGPGGGPGTPAGPPPLGSNGAPASTTLGPNGGYPDDAPYPIPLPTTSGSNTIPDGDFSDPTDIDKWKTRDGKPLSSAWSVMDGAAVYHGAGDSEAYYYPARTSVPPLPGVKYSFTFTGTLRCDPGVKVALGIGIGYNTHTDDLPGIAFQTELQEYATGTEVSITYDHDIEMYGATITGIYVIPNIMPVMIVRTSNGEVINAYFDDVSWVPTKDAPATCSATPAGIDFPTNDLTGWTLVPYVTAFSPALTIAGHALKSTPTSEYGLHQYLVFDTPIDFSGTASGEASVGSYIFLGGKVWCDDPTVFSGVTVNGVAIGLATKFPGGDYEVVAFHGVRERGDYTPRTFSQRIGIPPSSGVQWYVCVLVRSAPGFSAGFKDLTVDLSIDVVDP